ncbi:MAG: MFS transporter [Methanomassiliicoccus sp.]|nr:MFS transporter [Methanomassiliicoccus sp.]
MQSATPSGHSAQTKRSVQLVAGVGSCVAPFLVASMVVAAPAIGEDLGAEVALLPWLTGAFFLVAASLLIPMGRIADLRGSKKVFTVGMVVYLASALVCALAPDMVVLIVARGVTGAGAAMVFGTSIALLGLVFPEPERGKAIGLNVTSMFVGFTAGLLAGGLLTYYLTWRYLFLIAAALAAAALYLVRTKVRGECELSRARAFDPLGMGLLSASMLLLFFGLSQLVNRAGQYALAAGAAAMAVLFLRQRGSVRPILGSGVSKNRSFLLAVTTNIIFQAGAFAVPFLLSLHYQLISGLDARTAAIVLLLPQVLMSIASAVGGRLTARTGDRSITISGAVLNAIGLSFLLTLSQSTPIVLTLASLALVGIGTGLFMPALMDWAMGAIERQDYGVASAVTETARLTGMTLSNVIVVIAFTFLMGTSSVGPGDEDPFLASVRICSLIYLALSLLSAVPSLFMKGAQER